MTKPVVHSSTDASFFVGREHFTTPRPGGFIIDVPVTLSVAIRGEGLTEEQACKLAQAFASALNPTEQFIVGYNSELAPAVTITEATLESPSDESPEVLEELEAEG